MHGRPRSYKNKIRDDPKAAEGYRKKVDAISRATTQVLECKRLRRYEPAALDASAMLLKLVPEIYSVWNYRREALADVFAAGGAPAQTASIGELALTEACLRENPKSYATWHHRKWIVRKGMTNLQRELALVTELLKLDGRNFHAWGYRMLVARLLGLDPRDELAYSGTRVEEFSNYSAWHYRTILLPRIHCGDGDDATETGSAAQSTPLPLEVLDEEFDTVHQAMAVDCKDQSPWMYYRWLLGNTLALLQPLPHLHTEPRQHDASATGTPAEGNEASVSTVGGGVDEDMRTRVASLLEREAAFLQEDHFDKDARWPLLSLAWIKDAQARHSLCDGGAPGAAEAALAAGRQLFQKLVDVDPLRAGYYRDLLEGRAGMGGLMLGRV